MDARALHASLKKRVTAHHNHTEFHRVSSVVAEQRDCFAYVALEARRELGSRRATRCECCDPGSQQSSESEL